MIHCMPQKINRCEWVSQDPDYIRYHDEEWGVPLHDDQKLFEFLILEGAQAGLSWLTILRKRENYRRAFDNFDAGKIARYGDPDIERLLNDAGIVRNRLKILSAIRNAQGFLDICESHASFDQYIWQFTEGKIIQNNWQNLAQIPASTEDSLAMSKALKMRGFNFVGETICYAFMQATGMVNDHSCDCFRHKVCRQLASQEAVHKSQHR